MPMLIRNTLILAKLESTYGVDATPSGATDALLVSDASFELAIDGIERSLMRPTLGGSEQLVGTRRMKIEFTVELSGSGTAGTAPAWGPLLRACGMAEIINAGSNVTYSPVSTGFESATIYYYLDGVVHKALGCRGTVQIGAELGSRPTLKFSFTGIDGGIAAAATPTATLTSWRKPVPITDPACGDITLGCTFAPATGSLSGGDTFPSRGLSLDLGHEVQHTPLLGGESVDITARGASGKLSLDVSPTQAATMHADIIANATGSMGFQIGTAAGSTIVLYAPAVQRISPKWDDYNGRALLSMDLRLVPSAGNDDLFIVAK